jgi:hypothetical protein
VYAEGRSGSCWHQYVPSLSHRTGGCDGKNVQLSLRRSLLQAYLTTPHLFTDQTACTVFCSSMRDGQIDQQDSTTKMKAPHVAVTWFLSQRIYTTCSSGCHFFTAQHNATLSYFQAVLRWEPARTSSGELGCFVRLTAAHRKYCMWANHKGSMIRMQRQKRVLPTHRQGDAGD